MKHCHYESFTWGTGRGMQLVPYYLGVATNYPSKFEIVAHIMSKIIEYQETLRKLTDWEEYLLQESGLPGPRGNIELAQSVKLLKY